MTFENLLDILAEQFSCDAAELSEDTSFEDLGVDAEDLVELAWQLGEATGTEVEEDRLTHLTSAVKSTKPITCDTSNEEE